MSTHSLNGGKAAGPPPGVPDVDAVLEMEESGPKLVAAQQASLPRAWRRFDRALVATTEITLFLVGAVFTLMVSLEVLSRYVFDFSMFFVNAAARFLLVWFFLLGAGIALRHGAHVGFELLLSWMSPARRRTVVLVGYVLSLIFFVEMLWGGVYSLRPALAQNEAGLGISLIWIVAAVPVGFVLLTYHMSVLMYVMLRQRPGQEPAP
jgi:TRAP-type transport system small permease protein